MWWRFSEEADNSKEREAGTETEEDTPSDSSVSARRVGSTRTVGTKRDPVSYTMWPCQYKILVVLQTCASAPIK